MQSRWNILDFIPGLSYFPAFGARPDGESLCVAFAFGTTAILVRHATPNGVNAPLTTPNVTQVTISALGSYMARWNYVCSRVRHGLPGVC